MATVSRHAISRPAVRSRIGVFPRPGACSAANHATLAWRGATRFEVAPPGQRSRRRMYRCPHYTLDLFKFNYFDLLIVNPRLPWLLNNFGVYIPSAQKGHRRARRETALPPGRDGIAVRCRSRWKWCLERDGSFTRNCSVTMEGWLITITKNAATDVTS